MDLIANEIILTKDIMPTNELNLSIFKWILIKKMENVTNP